MEVLCPRKNSNRLVLVPRLVRMQSGNGRVCERPRPYEWFKCTKFSTVNLYSAVQVNSTRECQGVDGGVSQAAYFNEVWNAAVRCMEL